MTETFPIGREKFCYLLVLIVEDAGAFVDAGGVLVLLSLQPVSNPQTTSPSKTIRVYVLFIVSVVLTKTRRGTRKIFWSKTISLRAGCRLLGNKPRLLDQVQIAGEIAKAEVRQAALLAAQEFARPAQFQVRLGDAKAVGRSFQHLQPLPRLAVCAAATRMQ